MKFGKRGLRGTLLASWRNVTLIVVLTVAAVGVGGYIVVHQRLQLPAWVPLIGNDTFRIEAEFQSAKAVAPGQGQPVTIAGVQVGQISNVQLEDGRAIVTMEIQSRYRKRLYRNATALLRPRTGLEDMTVDLNPGTPSAGYFHEGGRLSIAQTTPPVSVGDVLKSLDRDTREALVALIHNSGSGLRGNSRELGNSIKRFKPMSAYTMRITAALARRKQNIRRFTHNLRLLSEAVGEKDRQLAAVIDSAQASFGAVAAENQQLRDAVSQLPATLNQTQKTLVRLDLLARELGPTMKSLQPGARALNGASRNARQFLRSSTPVLRDRIRPAVRELTPEVQRLRQPAQDIADIMPNFQRTLSVTNQLFNALGYNPTGSEEGYLFWLFWGAHSLSNVFTLQDAHGPLLRGALRTDCPSLGILSSLNELNPVLGTIIKLANLPTKAEVGCQ